MNNKKFCLPKVAFSAELFELMYQPTKIYFEKNSVDKLGRKSIGIKKQNSIKLRKQRDCANKKINVTKPVVNK